MTGFPSITADARCARARNRRRAAARLWVTQHRATSSMGRLGDAFGDFGSAVSSATVAAEAFDDIAIMAIVDCMWETS